MSDDPVAPVAEQPSPSGETTMMGKMIVPDLSSLTIDQNANVQVMTSVTKEAASALEKIVTAQQSVLEAAVTNLQTSLEAGAGRAGIPGSQIPHLQSQVQNLTLTVGSFCTSAETLTASTTKAFDTLSQSVNRSLAKIEEVATKFSGG